MLLKRGPETAHVIPRAIRGLEFSAKLWGNEAREFAKTTRRLTEKHWEEIVKHATYYVTTNRLNTDDDNNFIKNCNGETVTPNPRAVIDLYWCVLRLAEMWCLFLLTSPSSIRLHSIPNLGASCSMDPMSRLEWASLGASPILPDMMRSIQIHSVFLQISQCKATVPPRSAYSACSRIVSLTPASTRVVLVP